MYGLRCKCFRYPVSVTGSQHRFSLSSLTDKTRCLDVRFLRFATPIYPLLTAHVRWLSPPPLASEVHEKVPVVVVIHYSRQKDAESTESANDDGRIEPEDD